MRKNTALDYIRAEFYKVLHRKYAYWFLLAMLAGVGLLVGGYAFANANGNQIDFASGAGMLSIMLSIGLYCTLLTGDLVFSDQYKFNTLKNEVSYGVPRMRIYLGKFLVSCVIAVVLCIIIIGFYIAACWLVLPHDPARDGEILKYIGFSVLNALPLWLGAQAVSLLCLSFIKSSTMASFAFLGLLLFLPGALKLLALLIDPVFMTIRGYMLVTPFDSQFVLGDWAAFGKNCVIGMGWFVAATLVGMFAFRKREIN